MKGVDDLDALLEKEINPELFVRDGKSLLFYLQLNSFRATKELKETRKKLAALVRAGGGKAITVSKGADFRIRVETDAATHTKSAGKEWHDPRFLLECVKA